MVFNRTNYYLPIKIKVLFYYIEKGVGEKITAEEILITLFPTMLKKQGFRYC